MKHISILVMPRALGSSITIPLEMLSAANDIANARRERDKVNQIELVGHQHNQHQLSGGMQVHCHSTFASIERTDLIFIPSIWRKPGQAVRESKEVVTWLRNQYRLGATVCAVANGAFLAAEAGILDNKPATTHWRYFHDFAVTYPNVKLQRKRFTTNAERIYCTGSVNAIRDIMLHFIAELYDTSIANEIAQHFTHELKPSFESELLSKDQHHTHHDELIIAVQEWLLNHFQQEIVMAEVANRFGLSVRSLNRRFKQATNTTPINYLQKLRLEHAKQLLKQSNLVIAEVAGTVGYQDTSYFSELFKKTNSMTPNEYRQLVRNKLFLAESKQPNP
ncbi:MAG: helix-turn-helix domain-containing protein [Pseudomonadales bacterium]|nr:helix-turn-helix domain-containing protein [Pseudomonadales bacterium]